MFFETVPSSERYRIGSIKKQIGQNLFMELNERSKEVQVKQEGIAKQYDSLMEENTELKHLKNNMDDHLSKEQ